MLDKEIKAIEEETEAKGREMVVNLNASFIMGIISPKTMKMLGELMGRKVVILINNGATHNSLFEKLVEELKIQVKVARFNHRIGR